ncbi:MAG: hypothetical protein Q4F79_06570 [Eubacteriales bacterium]|nr:hypothetical protein [Eubacteriales bacterium]
MRYYGIKRRIQKEKILYFYVRRLMWLQWYLSIETNREKKKARFYQTFSVHTDFLKKESNAISENRCLKLNSIITADLVAREDIDKLKRGLKKLLKHYRGSKFLGGPIGGLEEFCSKIENMDSAGVSWFNNVNCGVFDFSGLDLESDIEYFTVKIRNINASFLAVESEIHLSESAQQSLQRLIVSDYRDDEGYVHSSLMAPKGRRGAIDIYGTHFFNDENLKADKLFENIGCLLWKFHNKFAHYLPLVLHGHGICPSRIECYFTDIDYHEKCDRFWNSVGIQDYQGQFINRRHKIFFRDALSGRYELDGTYGRLLCITNNKLPSPYKYVSTEMEAYEIMQEYSVTFFRLMLLSLLSKDAGGIIIEAKKKLDKIKLERNNYNKLLKLRYKFSKDIDLYQRYFSDHNWNRAKKKASDLFEESDSVIKQFAENNKKPFFCFGYDHFYSGCIAGAKKIEDRLNDLEEEKSHN